MTTNNCFNKGPVSPISASKVNDFVRVLNLTGTTEGLFIGNLWVERQDWFYFAFHPFSGFQFKEVELGIYEHWVYRNEHAPLFQGIFHTFPDQQSINLKDLYVKHPSKPNLWAYNGRNDDIVVLSNGYKISPLDTEALVTTHPAIEGCLMVRNPHSSYLSLQAPRKASSIAKACVCHTDRIWKAPGRPPHRVERSSIRQRRTLQQYMGHSRKSQCGVSAQEPAVEGLHSLCRAG